MLLLTPFVKTMHQIKFLVISFAIAILLPACNVNPTNIAQTQIFSEGGSQAPTASMNALKRSYDYHEVSQEAMLKRMRGL